jgi:hypothetical protein
MDPISLTVGAVVASSLYVFAYRRKGSVSDARIGARSIELASAGQPDDVFEAIAAIGPPYTVDDKDRVRRVLVLSSRPSIWSYGFLYPVIVRASADGAGTTVTLGVRSRLIHIGPGMGLAHERCARAIASLLTVPPARLT